MDIKEYTDTINRKLKGTLQVITCGDDRFIVYRKQKYSGTLRSEINLFQLIELVGDILNSSEYKKKKEKAVDNTATSNLVGYSKKKFNNVKKEQELQYSMLRDKPKEADRIEGYPYGDIPEVVIKQKYFGSGYQNPLGRTNHSYMERCNVNLDDETIERLYQEAQYGIGDWYEFQKGSSLIFTIPSKFA